MGSSIGGIIGSIGGSFLPIPGGTAIGGAIGSAIGGGLSGGGSSTQGAPATGTNTVNLPSWLQSPYANQVSQATSLSQTPYNQSMNYNVAGFTPQQQQAFGLTNQLVGQYQQPFNQALSQTGQLGQQAMGGLNNPQFQSYMNPYIQNVLDTSRQQQFQNYGMAQNQLSEQAAGSGAFGNSRYGLAQGLLGSNFLQNLGAQQASTLAGGFNTAMNGYQTGINQGLAASNQLGNLAIGQQATGLQGIGALYGMGSNQQQLAQQQLTATQQNALQQAQYPWQQLSNAQSIMSTPAQIYGHQTTNTQTLQQPSALSQGFGIGSALSGLGAFGSSNPFSSYMNSGSESIGALQNQIYSNPIGSESLTSAGNTGFMSSLQNLFSGFRRGGLVTGKEGQTIDREKFLNKGIDQKEFYLNDKVGYPGNEHKMNKHIPTGFRKGGRVDASQLQQGMRTGGLLHKAPKKSHGVAQGLAALQAISQLQQGLAGGQGLPQPSPSMAAPGAQQPQIGMMVGGQVPHSLGGYAKGGIVGDNHGHAMHLQREYGINGCYSDGGTIDPISKAFTNPGSNYTLGSEIAFQRANNYISQLLGQNPNDLPEGYRTGGMVGYEDGGPADESYLQQGADWLVNNHPDIANYVDQLGSAYRDTGIAQGVTSSPLMSGDQSWAGQHLPSATVAGLTLPIAAAGDALGAGLGYMGRGAVGAAGAYPAVTRGLIGTGALAVPAIEDNQRRQAALQALQTQAQMAAVRGQTDQQQALVNKAQAQASPTGAVSQADIDWLDNLHNTANNTSPKGPFGSPLNMPMLALAAGMGKGYEGHGNFAADLMNGAGGVEQQAMQQRQLDALTAYRGSMMGLNEAKAQADLGNLQLKQQDAPYRMALQKAQTVAEQVRAQGGTPAQQAQNWARVMAPSMPELLSMTPDQKLQTFMQMSGASSGQLPSSISGFTTQQLMNMRKQ